ncbi:ribonucleoprotein [Candidatus Bathyarchaeota archaeon]|nr:MAG: ribonucleoprotein [Candidatus Bathyarchaeota archaeon]
MRQRKMEPSKKPLNVLVKQVNSQISLFLKNGVEYKGVMTRCDGFMNILLEGAREYINDQQIANYGSVLIRGNNILYIVLNQGKI